MDEFLLLYRLPADHQNDDTDVASWNQWLGSLGDGLVELGRPVTSTVAVGPVASDLRLTGYSVVRAKDLATAREIAGRCPAVAAGGGVEVAVLMDMPEGHGPH